MQLHPLGLALYPVLVILTYKYQLRPTPSQVKRLNSILEDQRLLYNAALQERIGCYTKTGKSITLFDQCKSLTKWRQSDAGAKSLPANLQRWTLRRLDAAFQAFFRRCKAKSSKAGFPRYRAFSRWHSFGFSEFSGIILQQDRLQFCGMALRMHMHRPLPDSKITGCQFTKTDSGWCISIQVKLPDVSLREVQSLVGLDVGLSHLAATSEGELIANPRVAKKYERELRRRQRAMMRCKRGSKTRERRRRQVNRCHRKIANTRATYLHQISADLVCHYDLIALEDLNICGMVQSRLAKSIHDASWHRLRENLSYKAARAGVQIITVHPRYTSQLCSECGTLVPKKLSDRVHRCQQCGVEMDRDVNAARVILHKAVVGLGLANVIQWDERPVGQFSN